MLFSCRFTGSVKLKGIIISGEDDNSHPAEIRLWVCVHVWLFRQTTKRESLCTTNLSLILGTRTSLTCHLTTLAGSPNKPSDSTGTLWLSWNTQQSECNVGTSIVTGFAASLEVGNFRRNHVSLVLQTQQNAVCLVCTLAPFSFATTTDALLLFPLTSLRIARFSNVQHLSIHISKNFGEENTRVYFIGLRGEYSEVSCGFWLFAKQNKTQQEFVDLISCIKSTNLLPTLCLRTSIISVKHHSIWWQYIWHLTKTNRSHGKLWLIPFFHCLFSSFCLCHFRHTGMKWQYVTTKHRRTRPITKWRASSHKPISYLDLPGACTQWKRWPGGVCQTGVRKI